MINKIFHKIRTLIKILGIIGIFKYCLFRIAVYFGRNISNYNIYYDNLCGKAGIDIGGPSQIFKKGEILPIYPIVKSVDMCNIHPESQDIKYLCDAIDLKMISSEVYGFVLSSHTIEHIANPLKALKEWLRIIRERGMILLVVPNKCRTVDHRRPVTSLEHLVEDYEKNIGEDDEAHLQEVLDLTDPQYDFSPFDRQVFERLIRDNPIKRGVHLHVYDKQLLINIFDYLGLQILSVDEIMPYHIAILGKKVIKGKANNAVFANKGER
ncbi:methyltransferase domain-containing protein [Candidatus Margulisiibacteriota bacterium]